MIDEYCLIKCIGRGAFGEVYLTNKKGSNQLYATKKVSKQKIESPSIKKYFINEINILKELNHKNIIRLETIRQTAHNFYIITEFYNGGGLSECLRKHRMIKGRPFSEEIVQHLMRQIIDALKYLHSKRIIHRDLKLDNILINFESEEDKKNLNMLKAQVKIIDFGFATYLNDNGLRYSILGSPINMDPILLTKLINQNISNLIGYDEKADVWSVGTVCYELITGRVIFHSQNVTDLVRLVEYGYYHIPYDLSQEIFSFLTSMLQYTSKNRLSAEELSKHPFLTKKVSEFSKINLLNLPYKVDNQGIILNIKKNPNLEKPLYDIQAKLNFFQQQQYYQNFRNDINQRFTPAYNYYANTGPKYYRVTTAGPMNRMELNPPSGQMIDQKNALKQEKGIKLLSQTHKHRDKKLYQTEKENVKSIESKHQKTSQNHHHHHDYLNKTSNDNINLNTQNYKEGTGGTLPIGSRMPGKKKSLHKEKTDYSRNKINQNKNLENHMNNNKYDKNTKKSSSNFYSEFGLPSISDVINPTPIPFSNPLEIQNPMHKGPMVFSGLNDDVESSPNPFSSQYTMKEQYINRNSNMGKHFSNNVMKKEISSDVLDNFDFNIGSQLEPEPEVIFEK